MISVEYELYTNDYCRRKKEKVFNSIESFVDWVFENCDGKYEDKISVPDPDSRIFTADELPYSIDVNRMWTQNNHVWIHLIRRGSTIIFSDGRYTNHIKHWNEDTKQMCRDIKCRIKNPQFNFG